MFSIVIASPHIAPAIKKVAASILSGIISCETPLRLFTPVIVILWEPSPFISAPILIKKLPRSTTSGSDAALSITVTPSDLTAAIITFAVARTLEPKYPPKKISQPFNFPASAQIYPCSIFISAPISDNPFR